MKHSRAQIVATIGPASKEKDILKQMISHQMDVARLNFSWGTYEEHAAYINSIREVAEELNKKVPIIQDLSGPRLQQKEGHNFDSSADSIITEKDLKDLEFGLEQSVDYVAMSYIGKAEDVLEIKNAIRKLGKNTPVIAKIERQESLTDIDRIVEVADAVMIARGDLGNAIPLERIPWVEKEIIEKCKKKKRPVITATQMLLSMTENPKPTRAEVTDVFFAIINGSDAIMLSEETATGKYPAETIIMMEKITQEAEKHYKREINML